ncbi:MAG: DUF805 domain-containing protein [Candidatus Thiodiazotropha sp.]
MEAASPYTPPQTELLGDQEAFGSIKIMSAKGRIGRLRYIAYTLGITFAVYLVMAALSGVAGMSLSQELAGLFLVGIFVLGYGVMLFVNVLLTIQRCHDFNVTGWLSLILLIPLVPLIFWIIPGTEGVNRFGPQPPPNKGAAVTIVIILLLVAVVGVLAAIAIPAYQEYVARATAAGM